MEPADEASKPASIPRSRAWPIWPRSLRSGRYVFSASCLRKRILLCGSDNTDIREQGDGHRR